MCAAPFFPIFFVHYVFMCSRSHKHYALVTVILQNTPSFMKISCAMSGYVCICLIFPFFCSFTPLHAWNGIFFKSVLKSINWSIIKVRSWLQFSSTLYYRVIVWLVLVVLFVQFLFDFCRHN